MASTKAPSNGASAYNPPQAASSEGPRFLQWLRRSRSDNITVKLNKQSPNKVAPTISAPLGGAMAVPHSPSPSRVHGTNGTNGIHLSSSSNHNHQVNGNGGGISHGTPNDESQHLGPSARPLRRLSKLKTVHPSGINRTNLNTLEKLLKSIDSLHSLVKTVLSDDLYADVAVNDRNALDAGILGDLACVPNHLQDDLRWCWKQARLKLFTDELIDDRHERVLETTVKLLASLPSDSKFQLQVTNEFVKQLYNQLPHPALTHLGTRPMWHQETNTASPIVGLSHPATWPVDNHAAQVPLLMEGKEDFVYHHEWRYRTADGSNNSRISPHLGRAGGPYAKTVTPKTILPADLPDPALVFEELMAADGPRNGSERRDHPAGVSSMLFYLATIIIHDCFQSDSRDPNTNTTSSYLDLSPLYGKNGQEQQTVRTFKRGMLKKDTFANLRICGFPPGVSALLIAFNRYHNYVAGQLYDINEGGRFRGTNEDHDLFQTARLITTGLYVNIILVDYVRTILNLQRTNSPWRLDPRLNADVYDPRKTPEGFGNSVSVEFNLLYRWHSATSKRDEEWTERLFERALEKAKSRESAKEHANPDSKLSALPDSIWDLTDKHLVTIAHAFMDEYPLDKPETWKLDGHERGADGHFDDNYLNELITSSTEDLAGAFGARNVPRIMRCVEMDGIRKSRNWKVATLNEFRRYFRLQPHKTFESISTVPGVADSLRALYGDPDHVELYPGLIAEDSKLPEAPGSGLCPGMTIGQAILADAVNLVRGDRFYTVDNTAANLTNWGFTAIQPDLNVAGGGVMYKLLMKAFPNFYKGNSVYALYPFTVPKQMMQSLRELGQDSDFDDRRPCYKPLFSAQIKSYHAVKKTLQDYESFHVPWGPHIKLVTKKEFMLAGDRPVDFKQHKDWVSEMYRDPAQQKRQIRKLFETITVDLLRERTHKTRHGYQVDAIAEIGNMVSAQSAAHFFHVPLKSRQHPHGLLTPQQYFTIMCICFAWAFLDIDESKDFSLRLYATEAGKQFTPIVKLGAIAAKNHKLIDLLHNFPYFKDIDDMTNSYGAQLIARMLKEGKSIDEITAELIPMMTGMVATHAQSFAQMLDLFFTKEYSHHWEHIQELSQSDDDEAFEQLERYALEAGRLSPAGFGLFRTVVPETTTVSGCGEDGTQTCNTKEGDTVFVNFVSAGRDPAVFPDPLKIKLDRPRELYIHQGIGKHTCPGKRITPVAMASMLRVFARLKNLKPVAAPYHNGPQGEESYLKWRGVAGTPFRVYMRPDGSDDWPFPTTLKVSFSAFDADDDRNFKCDMPYEEKKKAASSWWPPF